MALKRLTQELGPLEKEKWVDIQPDESNMLRWKLGLWVVNPESIWHGAYLKADMRFPQDYPYQPPTFKFTTKDIYHPNVYTDGNLCISILHKPGDDAQSGELASERWNVLHGVESVLRSVLLLLDDPEINSPANVDAGVLYRDRRAEYDARALETVERTLRDKPAHARMPTEEELAPQQTRVVEDESDFWNMSDDDFEAGSDTDMDELDGDDEDEDDDKSR